MIFNPAPVNQQVLLIFIRNTPLDMQALSESVANGNFEQVGFYAHKLKSAAGAIGYNQAYEDFKELEVLAKNHQPMQRRDKTPGPDKIRRAPRYCGKVMPQPRLRAYWPSSAARFSRCTAKSSTRALT